MSTARITELQRELLAVAKGGKHFNTWAEVNGLPLNERQSLRRTLEKEARVREIRREIHAIDPSAALYFSWSGGAEAAASFFAEQRRLAAHGMARSA